MGGCCVLYCSGSTKNGQFMKKIPANPERRKLWLQMINRPDWNSGPGSCICERHFPSNMWENTKEDRKRKLKEGAVPIIFPKPPSTEKNREVKTIFVRKRKQVQNSLLNDHAYVNKPKEIEIRLPNLHPKVVVLELNSAEASQVLVTPELEPGSKNNSKSKTENSDKVQTLVNRPIFPTLSEDQIKKLIATQEKKIRDLQKQIIRYRIAERREIQRGTSVYEGVLRSLFSEDQVKLLLSKYLATGTSKARKWLKSTIDKALRLKSLCGNAGYEEFLKLGYPLPSLRTLGRSKLKEKLKKNTSATMNDFSQSESGDEVSKRTKVKTKV